MSEIGDRMAAILSAFAARYPDRIVTRDALDPAQRLASELEKGVYTFLSLNEHNYTNVAGYEAQTGRQGILVVADIKVEDENPPKGSVVEDAEFVLIDEVKAFVRNLPPQLCMLNLESLAQSGQLDYPQGWVVFHLTYVP